YGEELASEPSQFLNEMPIDLIEDLSPGKSWLSFARGSSAIDYEQGEYRRGHAAAARTGSGGDRVARKDTTNYSGKTYDSVDSIAEFFKQRATQLGNTSGSFTHQVQSPKSKVQSRKPPHSKLEGFTPGSPSSVSGP